jgi:hypothetical protein
MMAIDHRDDSEPMISHPIEAYGRFATWIGDTTGLPDQLLHIHAGLIIWLVAAIAIARPLSSPIPLSLVYAAELGNEVLDRLNHGRWMPDTAGDVINTVVWPTLIWLTLRLQTSVGRKR